MQDLLSREWAYGDIAVLASKISDLAGLWLGVVARRDLATDVRIEMTQSGSAIAVCWDWLVVDMVHWESIVRKVRKLL